MILYLFIFRNGIQFRENMRTKLQNLYREVQQPKILEDYISQPI